MVLWIFPLSHSLDIINDITTKSSVAIVRSPASEFDDEEKYPEYSFLAKDRSSFIINGIEIIIQPHIIFLVRDIVLHLKKSTPK